MNPKVSVVIPTYNRAEKVRPTIESVLSQTFTDLEVIVVDDGSSDGTREILGRVYGDRIRYLFQNNQGVSGARNKGITEARGEWIAFLDSDDLWEPDKLERQFEALKRFASDCGACYTDTRLYNHPETRTFFEMADGECRHEGAMGINSDVLRVLVRPGGGGMVVCISSLLARTDLVRKTGGFDTNLGFYADSEFMFRLAVDTRFCYVNRPLVRFDRSPVETRHVGVSREWDKQELMLQENRLRLEKYLQLSEGVPLRVRKLIRQQLGFVHSGLANWYLENGQIGEAREQASIAARLNLTFGIGMKWFLIRTSPALALRALRDRRQGRSDAGSLI